MRKFTTGVKIIIKIFLFLAVIAFFLPFFSVSCASQEMTLSGFALSTSERVAARAEHNYFGFGLIFTPVVLLTASFLVYRIKNARIYNIYRTASFIAPVFNIFAAFTIRVLVKSELTRILKDMNLEGLPASVETKYGFTLYIVFNVLIFISASVYYFVSRETINSRPPM